METEYILDLSVRPNKEQVEKFSQDIKRVKLGAEQPALPFWDIRTGEIKWGYIGRELGVLLLKPGSDYNIIIYDYQTYPDKYSNIPQNIVNYSINHRLSALADIHDPNFDVNFEKLASQYYNGVFIDEEIPEELFIEMFRVMELKGDKNLLSRMYELTGEKRLALLREGFDEVPYVNDMDMYTQMYYETGELPMEDLDIMSEWMNHMSGTGDIEVVINVINDISPDSFGYISDLLDKETIQNIMDGMVDGNMIRSREKHKHLKRQLAKN